MHNDYTDEAHFIAFYDGPCRHKYYFWRWILIDSECVRLQAEGDKVATLQQKQWDSVHGLLGLERSCGQSRGVAASLPKLSIPHTVKTWVGGINASQSSSMPRHVASAARAVIYERHASVMIAIWRRPPVARATCLSSSPLSSSSRRRITYAPLISVLKMVWPWIVVQMLSSVSRPTQKPANKRAADVGHHYYSDNRLTDLSEYKSQKQMLPTLQFLSSAQSLDSRIYNAHFQI